MANTKGNGKSDAVKIFTIWLLKCKQTHTRTHIHTQAHPLTHPSHMCACVCVCCAHPAIILRPRTRHKPQAKLICLRYLLDVPSRCRRDPTLSRQHYPLSRPLQHCHVKLKFMANFCDRSPVLPLFFLSLHVWYAVPAAQGYAFSTFFLKFLFPNKNLP